MKETDTTNTGNKSKGFNLKEVIFIILLTAIATSMTTGVILYNQNKLTKNITYQDLNQDEDLKDFLKVYASLLDDYYEDVDKKGMLESALSAMFKYLGEDYSTYLNKKQTEELSDHLEGEYIGIGVTLDKDNKIIDFIKNGSASEAGLQIGDKIVAVNHEEVPTDGTKNVADYVSNKKEGEKLVITIERNQERLDFNVIVKKLYIPAIQSKILENGIGYLQITTFSQTLKEQVRDALKEMESTGINSIILDLRDNTGGYLASARDVASMFMEKGKLIYSLQQKDEIIDFKDETEEKRDYKMAILMNEASASASEVLIAALKENYGAFTVGTKSYGKGRVQQTQTLEDGSMVKYTTAKWLTPSQNCIDGVGIKPDYYVLSDDENVEVDTQLNKAIEVLNE